MADERSLNDQNNRDEHTEEVRGEAAERQAPEQQAPETQPDAAATDSATVDSGAVEIEPPVGTTTPGTLFASDEMEDMKSEEVKKNEADEAEKKKRKEAASQGGAAEKKYPGGTEFRYSGHTKVLPEEMTEAQIFAWVADDFPEVEKGRHSLRYDVSKGRLVPIPQAQKKGSGSAGALEVSLGPPAGEKPPVYRLLCADGVYEVRTNLAGTYVARLDSGITLAEGYYPAIPRPPARFLSRIVEIFKEKPDTEALIDIVYDRRSDAFRLVWNQKRASAGSVEYEPLPDDDNLVVYAEIHSHHRMAAYFSATDDSSERRSGVYGVVGRVEDEVPEARFRYSCGGYFREMLAEDLFDDPSQVAATVRRPAL